MAAPILSYEQLGLVQGDGWLFRGIDLYVGPRDRLALIGRNGAGKTTLLKCLADLIETDEGRRTIVPGTRVVLLEHVRSPVLPLAWLQRLLTPLQERAMGCHLDRTTIDLVRTLDFEILSERRRFFGVFRLVVARPPQSGSGRLSRS